MDEMLARLNRIYPNSHFVKIQKYNPDQWVTREYDSKFDVKGPMNKWKSNPLSYEEAQEAVEEGFRVGWVVPKNMCVVDIDNTDNPESQNKLINLLTKWEVKYSYNYSFRGMHLVFEDSSGDISSDSHSKCALNIDIDTRANGTGYIVLPCNDPHRKWGQWNDVVEETFKNVVDVDLEIVVGRLSPELRATLMGSEYTEKGVMVEKSDDVQPEFALIVVLSQMGSQNGTLNQVYYRCKLTVEGVEAETKTDSVTDSQVTISGKAIPLADGRIAATIDSLDEDADASVVSGWTKSVYTGAAG